MRPLLPALLLALFCGWSGTYFHGAGAAATLVGHAAVLGLAAWGWRGWDPLGLGRRWQPLPAVLWLALLLSGRFSTVPRAGWVALALLPVFLALPRAVAQCWATPGERRRGTQAVSVVLAGAAAWALVALMVQGSARAAQPLGHHLLLAGVLATLLPLALATAAANDGAGERRLALLVVALAALALLATRSASGLVAALAGAAYTLRGRHRAWLLAGLAGAVAVLAPRLLGGGDPSLLARAVYWSGGLRGGAERPLLGWGPGSTAWTLAPHLRPRPGVVPAGEVVGDLHSLPLQLWYELGAAGVLLAGLLVAVFVRRRLAEGAAVDPARRGALGGLLAAGVHLAAAPTLATTAGWVAVAIAAGAALSGTSTAAVAAGGPSAGVAEDRARGGKAAPALVSFAAARSGWLYAALAVLLLLPLDLAHAAYDLARGAPPPRARALMAQAVALDPQLPIYHARVGWLAAPMADRVRALREAALGAPGVAALQLAAGAAGSEAGEGGRGELRRACAADPLDGMAPLLLAFEAPAAEAPALAARALLATPRLAAAVAWEERTALWHRSRRLLWEWPGVDPGYARELVASTRHLPRRGPIASLQRRLDARPATALSLVAFRRLPWPAVAAQVKVRREAALAIELPAAAALPGTSAAAFPPGCLPPPHPLLRESAAAAVKPVEK